MYGNDLKQSKIKMKPRIKLSHNINKSEKIFFKIYSNSFWTGILAIERRNEGPSPRANPGLY